MDGGRCNGTTTTTDGQRLLCKALRPKLIRPALGELSLPSWHSSVRDGDGDGRRGTESETVALQGLIEIRLAELVSRTEFNLITLFDCEAHEDGGRIDVAFGEWSGVAQISRRINSRDDVVIVGATK